MNHRAWPLLAVLLAAATPCAAGPKDDIGYTALQQRLGAALPTGLGISVTQTEARDGSGRYLPDAANAQFTGKTIVPKSGAGAASSHATTVGANYYGLTGSIAPGVARIDAYEAGTWIGSGFLRLQNFSPPAAEARRVQNHSWIGTTQDEDRDADILRRIDLVVERDGVVVVAGVNNGAGSAIPRLLGSAYNVLAVGVTSGNSSYGPTSFEEPGRVKPDLVAPASVTSYSTPMVASAAALLLQAQDEAGVLSSLPADRQQPAKALLTRCLIMAGATKDEFPDWRRGLAVPAADGSVPLDYRYGAGELHIDNSHRLLTAGQHSGGEVDVPLTGWDFGAALAGQPRQYFFEIPAGYRARSLSVLVAWNRHIATSPGAPLVLTPSLANIDLALREAELFAPGAVREQSVSTVDNVEHVFLRGLPGGWYSFEVRTDSDWEYALAWDVQTAPAAAEDFDGDGDVDGADFALLAGCATGPSIPYQVGDLPPGCGLRADTSGFLAADLDQDRDVDQADFGAFQTCLGGSNLPPPAACLP